MRGANVHANQHLDVQIGGNLDLESLQNRSRSNNQALGISGGFSLGGDGVENKGNAFTKNIQSANDIGGASGVNAGFSTSNGMSLTRETVLTSLTSGGTARVNVQGNTQITGALLATVDEDGNDLNQLDFTSGSLRFTDLRNLHHSTQTGLGVSTNIGLGGPPQPEGDAETQTGAANDNTAPASNATILAGTVTAIGTEAPLLATDAQGRPLRLSTSNVTYSNTSQSEASNTLATLGRGNITVGGVQLEQDGQLTDAGQLDDSPLVRLNRDTTATTKDLWSVNRQEGNIDLAIDHRMFTQEGRNQIRGDIDGTQAGIERAGDTLSDWYLDVKRELGLEHYISADDFQQTHQLPELSLLAPVQRDHREPTTEELALLEGLSQLRTQAMASAGGGETGSILWDNVVAIAWDFENGGPQVAVDMLNRQVFDESLNELLNIQVLRQDVLRLNETMTHFDDSPQRLPVQS